MSSSEADDKDAIEKKRQHEHSDEEENGTKDEPIQARLRAKKARSNKTIYSSSSEEENSDNDRKKRSKKNSKSKSKTASKSKIDSDSDEDDVEEGEVSGDSSDDEENKNFDDGFDDDLMGDDEDRARLAAMTEREREEEIFTRLERRQDLQRRKQLAQKLRHQKLKNKAVTETSARSRERRLMIGSKNDSFDKLKQAMSSKKSKAAEMVKKKVAASGSSKIKKEEESGDDEKEDDIAGVRIKKEETSGSSDDDKMSDDERKDDDQKSAHLEPIDKLEDLEKICITRDQLIRWLFYPSYTEWIKGCFVRVNCGDHDSKGNVIYRLAEILGILETAEKYTVIETQKEGVPTKVVLRLKILDKEKEMMIKFTSNGKPSESEFEYFVTKMRNNNTSLPSRAHITSKTQDIQSASKYRMDDDDITRKLACLEELSPGRKNKNLALRKSDLIKDRQEALNRKDSVAVAKIQEELDGIMQQMEKRDAARAVNQNNLEVINRKNNNLTMEALTKAMNTRERDNSERTQEDPFTRRWGTPTLVHKKTGQNFVVPATPKNTPVASANSTPAATPALPAAKVDPFSAHNFDLNLDIDIGSDFPGVAHLFNSRRGN